MHAEQIRWLDVVVFGKELPQVGDQTRRAIQERGLGLQEPGSLLLAGRLERFSIDDLCLFKDPV
jgi:hypothetical protein